MYNHALRRRASWAALGIAIAMAVISVPFTLRWIAPAGMDWSKLSNVSQTYSAISVPLTAIALLGTTASLAYQARQTHVSHDEATLSRQHSLLSLAFEDPDLRACWGPWGSASHTVSEIEWRQFTYTNMILGFWHSEYTLGRSTDATVKFLASKMFRGEIGRNFWRLGGDSWREAMKDDGRRSVKFIEILDNAFREAELSGPPLRTSEYYRHNPSGTGG